MRIIESGNIQLYTTRCISCKSLIEFNEGEENYVFDQDGIFGSCEDWSIKCPMCGTKIPTRSICHRQYYDWRTKV